MVTFVDDSVTAVANATYWIYDIFVNATFIFKLLVILFFIYHFIKKTQNICNIFFYLLFIGFIIDIIAWALDMTDRYCQHITSLIFGKGVATHPACWYLYRIDVTYGQYNNTFSSCWMLLLSVNRLTAIVWSEKYDKIWSKFAFIISIVYLIIAPICVVGYSFVDYRCRFILENCTDANYWITLANVTGFGNGSFAVASVLIVIIAVINFRKTTNIKNNQNSDVKLIFQAAISSTINIIHYVFYYIVEYYRAYAYANKGYKYDLGFVFIDFIKFMAYPGHHFAAFLFLFVFS
uniref:Serpentine receptor class gamma n=1 Tax=Panagrolaimus davidi TaxID=227884 RepID=A0A914PAU1_9BILA